MSTTVFNLDNYRIRWDGSHNWVLEEERDVTNPKTKVTRRDWVRLGYYGRLVNALSGYAERSLRTRSSDATAILVAMAAIEAAIAEVGRVAST